MLPVIIIIIISPGIRSAGTMLHRSCIESPTAFISLVHCRRLKLAPFLPARFRHRSMFVHHACDVTLCFFWGLLLWARYSVLTGALPVRCVQIGASGDRPGSPPRCRGLGRRHRSTLLARRLSASARHPVRRRARPGPPYATFRLSRFAPCLVIDQPARPLLQTNA